MTLQPSKYPIQFEHVWKQYQVGLQHHRIGDALPMVVRGWFNRAQPSGGATDGKFWAVKDVSFSVQRGETLGIIGRNGAGKSTILKLLSGITAQDRGKLSVKGRMAALIEVGAGFHPDLTGRENVYLNGTILGLKRHEIRRLFDQIVAFAEVEPFIDTPVKRYSSGMYVRLGFAIAVFVNPDVLLIDEVLSVGDLAFQQKCLQRVQELKQTGTTMIFISHNLNAVQRICDRAILLSAGEVAAEGSVERAIQVYREQVFTKERERVAKMIAQHDAAGNGGGCQIESIQLSDDHGRATESFVTGEPMTIEIRYRAARRVERPVVQVGIDRMDGLVCHVASADHGDAGLPALDGAGVIRLRYAVLNLLPNAYRVNVVIAEEGRLEPLDSRKPGSFFTITSDHDEKGAVHLDHDWRWSATDRTPGERGSSPTLKR